MEHRKFWTRFFLAATILTACLIFFFSAQQGPKSSQMSDTVVRQVAQVVKPQYTQLPARERLSFLEVLTTIVRKTAHFSEFALLGFNLSAWLCLRRPDCRPLRRVPLAWGVATLYACTDELHQRFVIERSPGALDVLIDSSGAALGALLAALGLMLLARRLRSRSR